VRNTKGSGWRKVRGKKAIRPITLRDGEVSVTNIIGLRGEMERG